MTFPPLLAEFSWLAPLAFALGCGLLTAILLRRSYRYFGKRTTRGGSGPPIASQPRPIDPWAGAKEDASARIDRYKVELYDLARELTAELESKTILLRELVAQSERQIERLETLLDAADKEREERPVNAD